ncbi:MAG TPA: BlaI/MecI/CopY family transcriptional regulator [Phenylobacterium sp.]|uniref:BlaI/MecI/CopY family transcriptional regulator n=1 Tax=Phenylobacterium sp. TaxID=1871053 RepID=UPI002C3D1B2C|nr:BlaI/MecI/CopY family transcriptional regulator [Phenylobacterium sp.]HSV01657.1 BlaI/MecI/CopY family transcriptional regulator [Phenylobacterium sp.]
MAKISGAESQIMEALWAKGPLGADDIVGEVGGPQGWGEATVKTLINRLLKKKAIASEREGGRARYRPLVSRAEYLTGESQGLLDRLFGGELAPLVAHYAKHRPLSPEELERLKALIAELERDDD